MVQYLGKLDQTFAAVSDLTRRGILERLGRGDASISALAAAFDMTLTGMKKHVQILERAGLATTAKVGRVRTCRVGPRRLVTTSLFHTSQDRDGALRSQMEQGVKESYAALDRLLATLG